MGAPSTTKTEIAVRGHRSAAESTRHSGGSDEHDSEEEPAEEGTHRKSSQTQSGPVHCTRARAKGSGERRAWCCSLSSSGNHNAAVSEVFTLACATQVAAPDTPKIRTLILRDLFDQLPFKPTDLVPIRDYAGELTSRVSPSCLRAVVSSPSTWRAGE